MNESVQKIKQDLMIFQDSVQRLSQGIKCASSLWRDPKYAELSAEIAKVANNSRTVLVTGDKSCEAITKFEKIASEEY